MRGMRRFFTVLSAVVTFAAMFGCAGYERNTTHKELPWAYLHKELPEAERAVDAARAAGKNTQCPDQFRSAEELKDRAWSTYVACHTEEGIALAKEAIAKAGEPCRQRPAAAAAEIVPVAAEPPLEEVPATQAAPGRYKYCVTLHMEFDIDKAEIRPEYHDEVAKVGDFMRQHPTTTAVIEGHTDDVGDPQHNRKLSEDRAASVVAYLVAKFGIDPSRLSSKGYGSTRPVSTDRTEEARQKNRRIEAIIDCAFDVAEIKPPERLCTSLQMEFDTGSADIRPQYRDEIARVGLYMQKYPMTTAVIEGHTDNVGGRDFNMKLSLARAQKVVDYLVENFGIDRSRLTPKGYGFTRRIAYNDTPEGRQKNRRIDAVIDCVVK